MAYFKFLLLVILVVVSSVSSRPSFCDRHNDGAEFRCVKDTYRADSIRVRNIAEANVSFRVGKWLSICGSPGVNYSDQEFFFGAGSSLDIDFSEAGPRVCNELFIYGCKINGQPADCLYSVSPSPN